VSRASIRSAVIVAEADLRMESISAAPSHSFYISYFEHQANTFQWDEETKMVAPRNYEFLTVDSCQYLLFGQTEDI